MSSAVLSLRGKVAGLSRDRNTDDPELVIARGDLAAANIVEYVRKTIAAAPTLSPEQRDTIMAAFAGFAPGGVSA